MEAASKGDTFTETGEYRLGPSDEFALKVVGDETFTGQYRIDANGEVSLPLAGTVAIGGRTAKAAEAVITDAVKPFVKAPNVLLSVTVRKSFRVYFNGEFAKVGVVQIESPVSPLEAIALAGGLSPFANGRIVLIRGSNSQSRRYVTTYRDLCLGSTFLDKFKVERGDILIAE